MHEVAIIDCGIGNLFSIQCGLKRVSLNPIIVHDSKDLKGVDAIVLPGVGNFKAAMSTLEKYRAEISGLTARGVPLLGICLGMQLLFDTSQESPGDGLGLIEGKVVRLSGNVKTPHIGWNTIRILHKDPLVENISEQDYFYFVHSYYPCPKNGEAIVAITEYGEDFPSIVGANNIYGVQFHPEKSGVAGEHLLLNFASILKR